MRTLLYLVAGGLGGAALAENKELVSGRPAVRVCEFVLGPFCARRGLCATSPRQRGAPVVPRPRHAATATVLPLMCRDCGCRSAGRGGRRWGTGCTTLAPSSSRLYNISKPSSFPVWRVPNAPRLPRLLRLRAGASRVPRSCCCWCALTRAALARTRHRLLSPQARRSRTRPTSRTHCASLQTSPCPDTCSKSTWTRRAAHIYVVYINVHICMHVCMYIHTYTHTYIHTYIHTHTHTHTYTHACMHTCMHAYIQARISRSKTWSARILHPTPTRSENPTYTQNPNPQPLTPT